AYRPQSDHPDVAAAGHQAVLQRHNAAKFRGDAGGVALDADVIQVPVSAEFHEYAPHVVAHDRVLDVEQARLVQNSLVAHVRDDAILDVHRIGVGDRDPVRSALPVDRQSAQHDDDTRAVDGDAVAREHRDAGIDP